MIFRILIMAALAFLCATPAQASISPGEKAPALVVTDLKGHKFDLQIQQGKTVVITLWASWCPPCLAEIPTLNAFHKKHPDIDIIALSVDRPHDREAAQKVANKMNYPAAILADASKNDFDITGALPATYIIDATGNISAVFDTGPVTTAELEKAVSTAHAP